VVTGAGSAAAGAEDTADDPAAGGGGPSLMLEALFPAGRQGSGVTARPGVVDCGGGVGAGRGGEGVETTGSLAVFVTSGRADGLVESPPDGAEGRPGSAPPARRVSEELRPSEAPGASDTGGD
jgi:hypothetical protein